MKTVGQWLESNPHRRVISVPPDTTVFDALGVLARHDIGAMPVLEGDRVIGIFSERDYARHVALKGRSSRDTPVRDVMTRKVWCVAPDRTMDDVMGLMTSRKVRHLPVLDEAQRMVGLISIGDVVKEAISDRDFTIHQLEAYIAGSL